MGSMVDTPGFEGGPTVVIRKAMWLIRLASCCVMDHGFGLGVLRGFVLEWFSI
jgi:hypothetical protein